MIPHVSPPCQGDVHSFVTARIIEYLDKGIVPWCIPAKNGGIPMNAITKRPYESINLWLLYALGYRHNLFLTEAEAKSVGASIKPGQAGHWILAPASQLEKTANDDNFILSEPVFSVAQCEGIPEELLSISEHQSPYVNCGEILHRASVMPGIGKNGNEILVIDLKACISLPTPASCRSFDGLAATMFHLYIHSTGEPNRLNRTYSIESANPHFNGVTMEEIVAEMGAAHLCAIGKIEALRLSNANAYAKAIKHVLMHDNRFILQASAYAQQSVEYILNGGGALEVTGGEQNY